MDQRAVKNLVKKYVKIVSEKYPVEKAWLFGSYANGTSRHDSDIDIAILFKGEYNIIELQIELMKLRRKIDYRIEAHPLTKKSLAISSLFKNEIKVNGVEME